MRLEQFTEGELDAVLKKIKKEKLLSSTKYSPEENRKTYSSDYAMLSRKNSI